MKNKKMVVILAVLLIAILAGASVLYDRLRGEAPNQLAVKEPTEETWNVPDFKVVDAEGNTVKLSDFAGQPIVLNFWASWCGPCKEEMPEFEEVYAEYGDQVQFLLVNMTDGSHETFNGAAAYIEEQGYTFPVYYDIWNGATVAYSVSSIPATYFIDMQGNGVAQAKGALDKETLLSGIEMILP